ncbi:GTP cyclohydrolase I FolE [Roseivirga misakiensis]|uniref:GTP cyclohydrolase 1 n=1 Tax=Roseivirga misakiensis TaxID=1563681 RepID=A0A1E5SY77_9BACT|nr:GTP cyclohydrolase I FolE [Roseivirga misakiensis]OEK04065.1 GTP cyclohydrolase I FolE [Roseivirga misakiensis]
MSDKTNKTSEEVLRELEEMGDAHIMSSIATPLRSDAFDLSDDEKIEQIQGYFEKIMHTLGLDLTDDSLKGTPKRVAKLFVNDLFKGLNEKNKPSMSTFENKYQYAEMLVEKDITLYSNCEHHFLPIVGKAHVAYIPTDKVIGLSKINRIVDYFSRRPQVQERLAIQILNELKTALDTEDVAVYIDAEHMCVSSRGASDQSSSTVTVEYSGKFKEEQTKNEFLAYINNKLK